jgi:hypothetical protein
VSEAVPFGGVGFIFSFSFAEPGLDIFSRKFGRAGCPFVAEAANRLSDFTVSGRRVTDWGGSDVDGDRVAWGRDSGVQLGTFSGGLE